MERQLDSRRADMRAGFVKNSEHGTQASNCNFLLGNCRRKMAQNAAFDSFRRTTRDIKKQLTIRPECLISSRSPDWGIWGKSSRVLLERCFQAWLYRRRTITEVSAVTCHPDSVLISLRGVVFVRSGRIGRHGNPPKLINGVLNTDYGS